MKGAAGLSKGLAGVPPCSADKMECCCARQSFRKTRRLDAQLMRVIRGGYHAKATVCSAMPVRAASVRRGGLMRGPRAEGRSRARNRSRPPEPKRDRAESRGHQSVLHSVRSHTPTQAHNTAQAQYRWNDHLPTRLCRRCQPLWLGSRPLWAQVVERERVLLPQQSTAKVSLARPSWHEWTG